MWEGEMLVTCWFVPSFLCPSKREMENHSISLSLLMHRNNLHPWCFWTGQHSLSFTFQQLGYLRPGIVFSVPSSPLSLAHSSWMAVALRPLLVIFRPYANLSPSLKCWPVIEHDTPDVVWSEYRKTITSHKPEITLLLMQSKILGFLAATSHGIELRSWL